MNERGLNRTFDQIYLFYYCLHCSPRPLLLPLHYRHLVLYCPPPSIPSPGVHFNTVAELVMSLACSLWGLGGNWVSGQQ